MGAWRQKRRASSTVFVWLGAVIFFAAFSYLIPKTCDDWIFTAQFLGAPEKGGLVAAIAGMWRTLNGRVLGNGLSILLAGSKPLRTLFKLAAYCALYFALGRVSGLSQRKGMGWAAVFTLMMLVPAELRKQTYAWDAGFINYVVPTALLLCYLLLVKPVFYGERVQDCAWRAALCLLIGLAAALFVENVTACALVLGCGVLILQILTVKRVSVCGAAFLLGAVLGTALMLSSPTYAATLSGGDGYRALPTNLFELLNRLKSNYQAFSCYSLAGYPLLHLVASGASIALLRRGGEPERPGLRLLRRLLPALLCALPVYFYSMTRGFDYLEMRSPVFEAFVRIVGSPYPVMALDLLLYGLYVLSIACVFLFFVPDSAAKRLGLTCVAAALVAGGPMLLVWPTDFRCFLPSYLFLACAALILLHAVLPVGEGRWAKGDTQWIARCVYAVMAAVCACNLALYISCPARERTRVNYIEQQMRIEADVIVLPEFDCEKALHYPTVSLGDRYYYRAPGDIEMPFLPYAEWKEEFSFGLSQEEIDEAEARHAAEDGAGASENNIATGRAPNGY